jgi:hypothetical protein
MRRGQDDSGLMPDEYKATMAAGHHGETHVLLENLPAAITYHDFRDGDEFFPLKKELGKGAIAITQWTLIVVAGGYHHIGNEHQMTARRGIEIWTERGRDLCFAYDPAGHRNKSGRVEIRLRTKRADELAAMLRRLAIENEPT